MPKAAIRLKAIPDLPDVLTTIRVRPANLFRVSSRDTGEPFFGKHKGNRFDDPHPDPAARYGTSYFGETFDVAVAETLLHDRTPEKGYFYIERAVILNRYLIEFEGDELVLANVTGAELRRMGGHAGLSGTSDLKIPQRWSSTIYHHADNVDGFAYISRHLNNAMAYVVFDRGTQAHDEPCDAARRSPGLWPGGYASVHQQHAFAITPAVIPAMHWTSYPDVPHRLKCVAFEPTRHTLSRDESGLRRSADICSVVSQSYIALAR